MPDKGQWIMEPPALNSILFVTSSWKVNFYVKCLMSIKS